MSRETLFMAQAFRVDGRKLVGGTPEKHRTKEAAVTAATRMGATKAGSVAFQVTGDPEGEFDPPVVLYKTGRLPSDLDEAEVLGDPA
jgi:hypothetical protein